MKSSRRQFLKTSAALAGASLFQPRQIRADGVGPAPLQQFGYGDVELLEGPLRQQFQTNHAFYARLDEDALLKPFRQRAGLPAPGEDMGGWYSWAPLGDIDARPNNGFAPGHSFGQYLSGLSRDYAATGNKATQEKVHRLVRNFAPAISAAFLGRQPLSRLHLRQDLHRPARRAPVCRRRPMRSRCSTRRSIPSPPICRRDGSLAREQYRPAAQR